MRHMRGIEPAHHVVAEFAGEEQVLLAQRSKDADSLRSTTHSGLLIGGLLAAVLSLSVGFMFARGLLRQLGGEPDYAVEVVNRIAAGELTTLVERVVAGHLVAFAALPMQPHPGAPALRVDISHPHLGRGAHAGEHVDHQCDEFPVARIDV